MKFSNQVICSITILVFGVINWFGNYSPTPKADTHSRIVIDSILSESLNSYRKIAIYLPPDFKSGKDYPVFYCTDGQYVIEEYKVGIDSLMNIGQIPKIILVGVFSNEEMIPNKEFEYRNYEYIKGWANTSDTSLNHLYADHLSFFSTEVPHYLNTEYGIVSTFDNSYFYGFSNGAGFGVSMSAAFPRFAKTYICFSLAGAEYKKVLKWNKKSIQPFYYIGYGSTEPLPLKIASQDFERYLAKRKLAHKSIVFEGGHERDKWKLAFYKVLSEMFVIE